jgi:hypothetical protein
MQLAEYYHEHINTAENKIERACTDTETVNKMAMQIIKNVYMRGIFPLVLATSKE